VGIITAIIVCIKDIGLESAKRRSKMKWRERIPAEGASIVEAVDI